MHNNDTRRAIQTFTKSNLKRSKCRSLKKISPQVKNLDSSFTYDIHILFKMIIIKQKQNSTQIRLYLTQQKGTLTFKW